MGRVIPISLRLRLRRLLEQPQSTGTFGRISDLPFSCSKHLRFAEMRQVNRAPTCNQILEVDCSPAGGYCCDRLHWSMMCLSVIVLDEETLR